MTLAGEVHRVLARCLVDPQFLKSIEDHGIAALAGYDLDAATARHFVAIATPVAKYAGLITTVQNNGLWQYFPATRLLLKRNGLDLKAFVAFRRQHQANRAQRGPNRDDASATFLSLLDSLMAEDPEFKLPLLAEVFLHERTIWEMQRIAKKPRERENLGATQPRGLAVNGLLRLNRYRINPIAAVSRILARADDIEEPEPTDIGYWWNPGTASLTIMALTAAGADLLSLVDGNRGIVAVIEAGRAMWDAEPADMAAFLGDCIGRGLLSTPEPTSTSQMGAR